MAQPLNMASGMPQMRAAFSGWAKTITLTKRTQGVANNGIVYDIDVNFTFKGTIQPLSPKSIILKPEGQRAWEWLQIHALAGSLNLNVNDQIVYNGRVFKVMAQNDYSLNNYIEYHVVRDYQAGASP